MSDTEGNKDNLLLESLTSRRTAVGTAASLLFAIAGAVSWSQGYGVASIILWAIDFSLITATAIYIYLKPLRDVRDNFNRTVLALLGGEADQQVAQTLIRAQHPLPLVMDMCRPVVRRTLAVQLSRPITITQLHLRYEVDRVEDGKIGKPSELMRIQWDHHWFSIAPSNSVEHPHSKERSKVPTLADLVVPLFVCESTVFALKDIKQLERDGKIELLWPVPAWLEESEDRDHLRAEARKQDWYTPRDLRIDGDTVMASLKSSKEVADIRSVLLEAAKGRTIPEETIKAFVDRCMSVHYVFSNRPVVGETTRNGFKYHIQQKSEFLVWVRGPSPEQILYQYQISFDRPAFVHSIRFGLATGGGNGSGDPAHAVSQRWCLYPPVVQCAFDLLDDTQRANQKEQLLEWRQTEDEDGAASDTPFIPGHGVTFIWRSRNEARDPASAEAKLPPLAQA
jgi:hypothetical protein